MQFIETSTLTIHADEVGGRCYVDVFSCKAFDPELAAGIAARYFGGWPKLTVAAPLTHGAASSAASSSRRELGSGLAQVVGGLRDELADGHVALVAELVEPVGLRSQDRAELGHLAARRSRRSGARRLAPTHASWSSSSSPIVAEHELGPRDQELLAAAQRLRPAVASEPEARRAAQRARTLDLQPYAPAGRVNTRPPG